MSLGQAIQSFFVDDRVAAILLLLALDFGLGVIAAVVSKTQSFRLSFVADVLRNDVVGKVLPFFLIYLGYKYAGTTDLVIPGFDLEVVMTGAFVVVLGALGGSALNSLRDLGLFGAAPDGIAGPDPETNG